MGYVLMIRIIELDKITESPYTGKENKDDRTDFNWP